MDLGFKVEPIDFLVRNQCRICGQHRTSHFATTDHAFVPGDTATLELESSELRPGDIIAAVIPKQQGPNGVTQSFEIYRRR